MNFSKMQEWEQNIHLTAMEIASMVLRGQLGDDVCERALEELDISDDEADILRQNLEIYLEAEGFENA